jgi:uncharacterized alpha-E superfamily protein
MSTVASYASLAGVFGRAERPMLARVADSLYWMSRYIERAEHVARLLAVNSSLLTDVGDLDPLLQDQMWLGVMRDLRLPGEPPGDGPLGPRVVQHMAFDAANSSSILSCIGRARENARAVREIISIEMWENLNALYWTTRAETGASEQNFSFLQQVTSGSMLFQGLTDQTMTHDQRWLFTQLGKNLERVDITCRVLENRYTLLSTAASQLDAPLRNIHWMGVLRMCCSLEAYRRQHVGDFDPLKIVAFVTLERTHPRSIRYGIERASEAISAVRAVTNPNSLDPAERVLGRLSAELEYAEPADMLRDGFSPYMRHLQAVVAEAAVSIQQTYFLQ